MSSRRQLREATVQLLYAREAQGDNGKDEEAIWCVIHDRSLSVFNRAQLKLLNHLQQGRKARADKFHQTVLDSSAAIEMADDSKKLARQFQKLIQLEESWLDKLDAISRHVKNDSGGWQEDLAALLSQSYKLPTERSKVASFLPLFPPAQEKLLTELLSQLNDFDRRAQQVQNPLGYPEQRELMHLRDSINEMSDFQKEVTELADEVQSKTETLDQMLGDVAENFDLKRFSKVDLAIMRLAAWELIYRSDLSASISINEAVEIAKRFGANESAAFVNGLLDQIAKNQQQSLN